MWCWDAIPSYRVYESAGTLRTFEIMPPPGYDEAVVAYFRGSGERTIRVELAKETRDGIELIVLRDNDADGDLEEAIAVEGVSRDAARQHYLGARDNREYRLPWHQADSLYDFLWDEIREKI